MVEHRRPSARVASAIRALERAGYAIARVEVEAGGKTIIVTTRDTAAGVEVNEWDALRNEREPAVPQPVS